MSFVKFKKLSCRMSTNYTLPMSRVQYPHATCQNSEILYIVAYIFLAMSLRAMRMSILRNGRVAVSDLGVKDPPCSPNNSDCCKLHVRLACRGWLGVSSHGGDYLSAGIIP